MRDALFVFRSPDGLLGRFANHVKEDLRYVNQCLDAMDDANVRYLRVEERDAAPSSPEPTTAPATPLAPSVPTPQTPDTRPVPVVPNDTPGVAMRLRTDCRLLHHFQDASLDSLQTALCMANVLYERVSVMRTCPLEATLFNPVSNRINRLKKTAMRMAPEPFGSHRIRIPEQPTENCWTFAVWQLCATTALWSKVEPFQIIMHALTFTLPTEEIAAVPPLVTLMHNYNAACDAFWKEKESAAHTLEHFGFADCFLYALLKCSGTTVSMDDEMGAWPSNNTLTRPSAGTVGIHRFETSRGSSETYGSVQPRLAQMGVVGGILHVAKVDNVGKVTDPHFVCFARHGTNFHFYDTNFATYNESEQKSPRKTQTILHLYLVSM